MTSYLVSDQAVTVGTLLATRCGAVVEVVLLTHVTASSHKAWETLTTTVFLALSRLRAFWVTVTSCKNKPMVNGTNLNE